MEISGKGKSAVYTFYSNQQKHQTNLSPPSLIPELALTVILPTSLTASSVEKSRREKA